MVAFLLCIIKMKHNWKIIPSYKELYNRNESLCYKCIRCNLETSPILIYKGFLNSPTTVFHIFSNNINDNIGQLPPPSVAWKRLVSNIIPQHIQKFLSGYGLLEVLRHAAD